jgi:hypothetical protein
MRRAVITSQKADSVSFDAWASVRFADRSTLSGSIVTHGVLRNIDGTWSAEATLNLLRSDTAHGEQRGSGTLVFSSPAIGSLFVLLEDVHGQLITTPTSLGDVGGTWWRLSLASGSSIRTSGTTPDPRLVDAYTTAIQIVGGGLETEGRSAVYHYHVMIGADTLNAYIAGTAGKIAQSTTAVGEVWINPTTFVLERARWNISNLPTRLGAISCTLGIVFADYNHAPPIRLPVGSGFSVPFDTIFDIFSSR